MPQTVKRKKTTPTKRKQTKVVSFSSTKSYKPVQKKRLYIFALAIVIVGIVGLVSSFAATPTQAIEAETFQFNDDRSGYIVPNGKAEAQLWWTLEGVRTINLDRKAITLSVDARAQNCSGSPVMEVKIDDQTILKQTVSSEKTESYRADVSITPGYHKVSYAFLNDYYEPATRNKPGCDRNLFVDKLVFGGESILDPVKSSGDILASVPGSSLAYGTHGKAVGTNGLLWSNGTVTGTITLPSPAQSIALNAYGQSCKGAPQVEVKLDNVSVFKGGIDTTAMSQYTFKKDVAAGKHSISVTLLNDYRQSDCDRNVYIGGLELRGILPKPTPLPPVVTNPTNPTNPTTPQQPQTNPFALRWAPPKLTNPITLTPKATDGTLEMATNRDYIIVMPNAKMSGLWLKGGHNVVMIGGYIEGDMNKDTSLYITGATGTVHIEGLAIDRSRGRTGDGISGTVNGTLQIQNTRITKITTDPGSGPTDRHGDVVQIWGAPSKPGVSLRIDRLTGTTAGQGLFLRPNIDSKGNLGYTNEIDLSNVDLYYNNKADDARSIGSAGTLLWFSDHANPYNGKSDPYDCRAANKIALNNVYLARTMANVSLESAVWPKTSDRACAAKLTGNVITWATSGLVNTTATGKTIFTGSATYGKPAGGEYVPEGIAGLNYKSPGYLTADPNNGAFKYTR